MKSINLNNKVYFIDILNKLKATSLVSSEGFTNNS